MFWILADCGRLVICFCVFANPSGFKLIVADQLACVFCESLRIRAGCCSSIWWDASESSSQPSPPFPSEVSNLFGEYLPTALVQCDRASRQLLTVLVPIHGVAMGTSMP